MMKEPKISKGTWIRTIVLAITLVNAILLMFGIEALPIGEEDVEVTVNAVYAVISAVSLVIAAIVAWWRNNSFTKNARKNDLYK